MFKTTAVAPILAALLVALTGCAPTLDEMVASPSTTPPASETPAAEATDPLDEVTRILIRTDHVEFGDDAGWTLGGFDYADDPAPAIEALTTIFGAEPTRYAQPQSTEAIPSTAYEWDGFLLGVREENTAAWYLGGLYVRVTKASVHGVAVQTIEGITVGTSAAEASSHAIETTARRDFVEAQIDPISVPPAPEDTSPLPDARVFVGVLAPSAAGLVDRIYAPWINFGP
ncbi:MAG: hypothetical protein QM598_07220 [Protaetiibacter sp.]